MKSIEIERWLSNLGKEKLKRIQATVNRFIKKTFKIRVITIPQEEDINSFEHFAIGVLNPTYND